MQHFKPIYFSIKWQFFYSGDYLNCTDHSNKCAKWCSLPPFSSFFLCIFLFQNAITILALPPIAFTFYAYLVVNAVFHSHSEILLNEFIFRGIFQFFNWVIRFFLRRTLKILPVSNLPRKTRFFAETRDVLFVPCLRSRFLRLRMGMRTVIYNRIIDLSKSKSGIHFLGRKNCCFSHARLRKICDFSSGDLIKFVFCNDFIAILYWHIDNSHALFSIAKSFRKRA